jgi:flavin reductase (DIM6/NTAB) family NADH-FMN oxidoreductase RutF
VTALTPGLVERFSQRDLPARAGQAMALVTVDAAGRPHPMLVSYLEVRALDARTLRVVVGAASGSAANLAARGAATLIVADAGLVAYVKCRAAVPPRVAGTLARFELRVEDVKLDAASAEEGGAQVTHGIGFAPPTPLDGDWAGAVMELLGA